MVKLEDYLDPFEKIIWRGKPDKKAFILQAGGALPFALFFFAIFLYMLYMGADLIGLPLIILALVIILTLQPLGAFRLYPNTKYMITNQRLLISDVHGKVWFTRLEKIKKVIVKKGYPDMILGTRTIYPITETYPYHPQHGAKSNAKHYDLVKSYNLVTEETDEVTKLELTTMNNNRPKLLVMKEPYKIQKILEEAIFGAGTNYINCTYCGYRYDLNKEGKCPHCGGTHRND